MEPTVDHHHYLRTEDKNEKLNENMLHLVNILQCVHSTCLDNTAIALIGALIVIRCVGIGVILSRNINTALTLLYYASQWRHWHSLKITPLAQSRWGEFLEIS